MKKILMSTSAIAFAGVSAGQANAAEWDVQVGGYYNAYAVFTSEDDDVVDGQDGFDIATDGEIHFTPSITLDNGIQFGARVELEGGGDDEGIDDTFLFIEGSFGRVEMGDEGSVFGQMILGGSGYTLQGPNGVHSGTMSGTFLGLKDAFPVGYGAVGNAFQIAGDAVRINYYTPRFAGFQVGVSYARGGDEGDRFFENTETSDSDLFAVSANYDGNIGNVNIVGSIGYESGDEAAAGGDLDRFNAGLGIGIGGVLVGASYAHYDSDVSGAGGIFGGDEADFYDVGVGYETGPWGVSLGYSHTDVDSSHTVDQIALNGSYDLGPGVTAVAFGGYIDTDVDGLGDFDGFTVGTGIQLSF